MLSAKWFWEALFKTLGRRHQAKLHLQMQRLGDPLQHGQRLAFVVGVFKLRNDRLLPADQVGQLMLEDF